MLRSLDPLVLTVGLDFIPHVDTENPQSLGYMWMAFNKLGNSVDQVCRLKNLSWRMWTQETISCKGEEERAFVANASRTCSIEDVPLFSSSVDTISEDATVTPETIDFPYEIRPDAPSRDSNVSNSNNKSRRHITANDFEKMVASIVKEQKPLSALPPQITSSHTPREKMPDLALASLSSDRPISTTPFSSPEQESSPDPPCPENKPPTTVVRGFYPSQAACAASETPEVDNPDDNIPKPGSSHTTKPVQLENQPEFHYGGPYLINKQNHNEGGQRRDSASTFRRERFRDVDSDEEGSCPRSNLAPEPSVTSDGQLNTSSSADQVSKALIGDNPVFDGTSPDDSDPDYVDESAIDDEDDSSDWEDLIEDSNKSSIDEKTFFQRVDSRIDLTSRRSLITLMIDHQNEGSRAGNVPSQSTSALPPTRTSHSVSLDLAVSPDDSDDAPLMMKRGKRSSSVNPITEVPRSAARPIPATASHSHLQAALSPRTTRRNMLATELTESLRRNLLWERQQKSSTANAVLKSRHTSTDVSNLKQCPEKVYTNKYEDVASALQSFEYNPGNYHSKGW